jgi:hypothetical protein
MMSKPWCVPLATAWSTASDATESCLAMPAI